MRSVGHRREIIDQPRPGESPSEALPRPVAPRRQLQPDELAEEAEVFGRPRRRDRSGRHAEAAAGCDHHEAPRAGERLAQRGDDAAVLFAIHGEVRHVLVKRRADRPIHARRPCAQAVEILDRAAMRLRARRREEAGALVGAGEAEHGMTGGNERVGGAAADGAGGAAMEDNHRLLRSRRARDPARDGGAPGRCGSHTACKLTRLHNRVGF